MSNDDDAIVRSTEEKEKREETVGDRECLRAEGNEQQSVVQERCPFGQGTTKDRVIDVLRSLSNEPQ